MKSTAPFRRPTGLAWTSILLAVLLLPSLQARNGEKAAAVDLRPRFEAFGLTPRVQGKRGTCSVFVVTQALELAFAQKENAGRRLSPEFLNWASNQAKSEKEDGGFFSDLWKGFEAHGICLESEMPYQAAFNAAIEPSPEARKDAEPRRGAGLGLHWIKEWDPKRGLTDGELQGALEALAQGHPVCAGFLWPKKAVWTEGVLQMCPRDQVFDGHSLLLVGYRNDPDRPGGGVLLIRNSGGSSRDGFVTYEYAKAYMNDAVWIGVE
ncbi:MAG: C1 family peptidase [Acidobacteriota bacterium]|nr:C1 family peptidase [Acidobacteriota bacterium]